MRIDKKRFKFIYLEITKNCNLKCPFCPSRNSNLHENVSIPLFKQTINKIKQYTNTVYLHVLGEPLIHPYFVDLVNICNQNDINVRLTTNGTLLYKYDFSNIKINKISISLQALINFNDDEINSYFEGLNNFLHQTERKLINGEMGIEFRLWNDKSKPEIILQNKKIIAKLENQLKIGNYHNVKLSEEDEFEWPNENSSLNNQLFYCHGGRTHLAILTNGDVVLCCLDYLGSTKLGNIYKESLDQILDNSPYQLAMQENKPYFTLCKKCKYRNKFVQQKVR